ncbi:MAG: hypothetical protein K2N05_05420 [Muribaculaceae bacterium]|nr:hypothetical protein [Muribaculaceae bacterium]
MKQNLLKTCLPLGALLLLSGCIDDNYDISDIDKTTQINVNDLIVPINIDAVELSEIIKIDDNSKIKVVNLNGKEVYAISQTGQFNSDPIEIAGFTAPSPQIEPTVAEFNILSDLTRSLSTTTHYELNDFKPQDVHFIASNVDSSIKKINSLKCEPLKIELRMKATGFDSNTTLSFKYLDFFIFKGLSLINLPSNYSYNPTTGLLRIENVECPGHESVLTITANGVNFQQAGTQLTSNHELNYESKIELDKAEMVMTTNYDNQIPSLPELVTFDVTTTVTDLTATAVSGVIEYNLEGDALRIDPVSLSDIPDFLSDEQTDLRLANPQIYIGLNNPLATYDLGFQTGLQLAAIRGDKKENFNLDSGQLVKVGYEYGIAGPYNYVISPYLPSQPLSEYANHLSHVGFSSLSDVLAGNGLPQTIEIALVNPELPEQNVTDFKLNNTIPGIEGTYEFLAPLALKTGENGSVIVYTGTEDGWNSKDLDKLTITSLTVNADVFSDLPIGAKLTIHPVDKEGNKISGVKVEAANIEANANGQAITLVVTGEIKNLDGIIYKAVVRPGSDAALSPDQTLNLKNIKAKVSGYYLTDFED